MYVGSPSSAAENYPDFQFAVSALADFDSVYLAEGAATRISFPISTRQLSFWNNTSRQWVLAKGTRELWIAADAQTPILRGSVEIRLYASEDLIMGCRVLVRLQNPSS
jgi:hypothetical protein